MKDSKSKIFLVIGFIAVAILVMVFVKRSLMAQVRLSQLNLNKMLVKILIILKRKTHQT